MAPCLEDPYATEDKLNVELSHPLDQKVSNPKIFGRQVLFGYGDIIQTFDLNSNQVDASNEMKTETDICFIDIHEDKRWAVTASAVGLRFGLFQWQNVFKKWKVRGIQLPLFNSW